MTQEQKTIIITALELAITQVCTYNDEGIDETTKPHNWKNDYFICNTKAIVLCPAAKDYLQSQKPTSTMNTKFTEHPQYYGGIAWWKSPPDFNIANNDHELVTEKRNFLRHIINKLK